MLKYHFIFFFYSLSVDLSWSFYILFNGLLLNRNLVGQVQIPRGARDLPLPAPWHPAWPEVIC